MKLSKCRLCAGAGIQLLMHSWFIRDGLSKTTCPICNGTGLTKHNAYVSAEWASTQARFRATPKAALSWPAPEPDETCGVYIARCASELRPLVTYQSQK